MGFLVWGSGETWFNLKRWVFSHSLKILEPQRSEKCTLCNVMQVCVSTGLPSVSPANVLWLANLFLMAAHRSTSYHSHCLLADMVHVNGLRTTQQGAVLSQMLPKCLQLLAKLRLPFFCHHHRLYHWTHIWYWCRYYSKGNMMAQYCHLSNYWITIFDFHIIKAHRTITCSPLHLFGHSIQSGRGFVGLQVAIPLLVCNLMISMNTLHTFLADTHRHTHAT